jgi:biopolymer transport protein ExbD
MRKTQEIEPVNLTPMIDIVFQMIIFFITTVDLDKDKFDKEMSIPEAPHASEAKPEPATIYWHNASPERRVSRWHVEESHVDSWAEHSRGYPW